MKNKLLVIALASAGIASIPVATFAADYSGITDNAGGFFVNGNVGAAILNHGLYDDRSIAGGISTGYRYALSPYVALGVEVGYTDLGSFNAKNDGAGYSINNAQERGWTMGFIETFVNE